jgi:Protein of unknown function (DUF2934)
MSEKRVVKITQRRTRKAAIAELGGAAIEVQSSSVEADNATVIDPDNRRRLVAAEAYFFAERRGFSGGNEIEDWVAAERLEDEWLNRSLNA